MAHKRPISWLQKYKTGCQLSRAKLNAQQNTPCPPLPFPSLALSCFGLCVCKQNGAQETNLWRTSANSQTFYFISFHLISCALSLTHSRSLLHLPACSFWVWKLKWNTTEMLQKSTNWHQLLLHSRRRGERGLQSSKKAGGKWHFPPRKKKKIFENPRKQHCAVLVNNKANTNSFISQARSCSRCSLSLSLSLLFLLQFRCCCCCCCFVLCFMQI